MRVWIDATDGKGAFRIFGMTLLERLLRGLLEIGAPVREVRIELSPDASIAGLVPPELADALPIAWSQQNSALGERLQHALSFAHGDPLVALSADCVVDSRLIRHLLYTAGSVACIQGSEGRRGAALRLEGDFNELLNIDGELPELCDHAIAAGMAKEFAQSEFEGYIVSLRRAVPPYLFSVRDIESRDRVERFLFQANYKGSTDFMTKHVYPPFVWRLVRPLAERRIHPNWVTALDIVAALGAIPLFAAGLWAPGLALAYLMSVLDSVDGKLARLTYRSSKIGEVLDHGLDIIHPPFWYMAWGYALGGGSMDSPTFQASLWMLGFYVADRLMAPLFKWRTGRSIHGFTDFDVRMRTYISRRNVNLPVFTAALILGWIFPETPIAIGAFYCIIAWQSICLVFHAQRVLHFWSARAQPRFVAGHG